MAKKTINIKPITKESILPTKENGNWWDCYVNGVELVKANDLLGLNENVFAHRKEIQKTGLTLYGQGDVLIIHLGFAADLGKGYEGHIISRSSTFVKKGLQLTNSIGLIDSNYNGDNDEWLAVFIATRPGTIRIGDRLVQFSIVKTTDFSLKVVDSLGNEDRGGYGSTGQ